MKRFEFFLWYVCIIVIFFAIYGVVCVKLAHSTHRISIIKSEVSTSSIVVTFLHGWVPEVVIASYAIGLLYIAEILDCVSLSLCSLMMCANDRVRRSYISKMLLGYILSIMCVRLSHFFPLSFMQNMGLCVFGLLISPAMASRISILYLNIIKSEVWLICNYLWLSHETMVCAVCLSIFILHLC